MCTVSLSSYIEGLKEEFDMVLGRKLRLRQTTSRIFTTRESEGVSKLLITEHMLYDRTEFKAYF